MTEFLAVDIGGTHARFARATIGEDGVPVLGIVRKYRVAEHPGFEACWTAWLAEDGGDMPEAACIALAGPVKLPVIKMTNSSWVIERAGLAERLGLQHLRIVNDFAAISHAVTRLPTQNLRLLFGESRPFPANSSVTIIGPGTGLGVGLIAYRQHRPHVIATEGGHIAFAPQDATERQVHALLARRFDRVSAERIVSGPGLNLIYRALADIAGQPLPEQDDAALWAAALAGSDPLAVQALDLLCNSYGAVAGDLALAHGAGAVVLAGSLTRRLLPGLADSGFHERFCAKGRYRELMATIPVWLAEHEEIGLFGAAACYGAERE